MLQSSAHRHWQGISIEGEQIDVHLHPDYDGRVSVSVYAKPALTGWDRAARVTPAEIPSDYALGEITVRDTELSCMAADANVPFLRQGFLMTLEPSMAPLLRAWLPRLFEVAALASGIVDHVDQQLRAQDPPAHLGHLYDVFTCVAAMVVLDGWKPDDAIAYERAGEHYIARPWAGGHESPLWEMFSSAPVRDALQAAYERATKPSGSSA